MYFMIEHKNWGSLANRLRYCLDCPGFVSRQR